ncbi:hypothetical protein ENUP19_0273G0013 [Entamoeba nuttalli]|uniref:Serine/threonine-protein kinase RIO1 n=2 Tax=Entamoeba nuttalli TaxID=412467 RepID=K2GHA8_ENTNP|nr:RIO1 family protein [Entamoeba nuttalli P19]EKE42086.1 RIO1 family protein [Entamoeba nuttalli P19]|eukprot:XP_008855577.1 RIO1 family protein [Entamoeba nuttalli P19]
MEQYENYIPDASTRIKDRSDRATNDQVLDHRTRVVLSKFIKNGIIKELHGTVSTGKEANVYHAFGQEFELAVKIFKTSILIFKDRERYVTGDYRYRKGFCKSNPRKMVKMWAEKEMRNLKRINTVGIPSPKVVIVKNNVLIMEFLGHDGCAAPRLKDAGLNDDEKNEAYRQVVWMMHQLYHDCNMVHADLSEYNLLWWKNKVYVIDVGQSIELSHPQANDFLRMDCVNISTYFNKIGIHTLSPKELFYTITNASIKENKIESIIKEHFRTNWDPNDEVFLNSFIPSSLHDLNEPIRDVFQPKKMTGVLFMPNAIPNHVKLAPLQITVNDDSASDSEKEEIQRKRMKKMSKKQKELYKDQLEEEMREAEKLVDLREIQLAKEAEELKKQVEQTNKELSDESIDTSEDEDEMNSEEYKEYVKKLKEEKKVDKEEEKKLRKEHKKQYKIERREKLKHKMPKKKKEQLIKHSKRHQTK